jgi:hypothetical protein
MKKLLILLIMIASGKSFAQKENSGNKAKDAFIKESYDKINESDVQDKELKKKYDKYNNKKDDRSFNEYEERATEVCLIKDIKAIIQITTKKPGAFVKYKPLAKAEAFQSSDTTNNCKIELPLGYTIIWTERNGKITSEKREILVSDNEIILIEENK